MNLRSKLNFLKNQVTVLHENTINLQQAKVQFLTSFTYLLLFFLLPTKRY